MIDVVGFTSLTHPTRAAIALFGYNRAKNLDEQVKSVIARELRRRDIDVTTTVEVGLRTQSDEAQLSLFCHSPKSNNS
jgi:2,3-bisphosphoglycerate-independent phosphoglycerate mutase